ncbi:hypothetical protein ACP70R_022247 [Stipagrostis hirtigluma subsp. patula]
MDASASSSRRRVESRETASTQRLTVEPYSRYKVMGAGKPITSNAFTVGRHRWTLLFYPGGYYRDSAYVAVFLRLESNLLVEERLRVLADFTLVDGSRTGGADAHARRAYHTFSQERPRRCGFAEYVRQHDLGGCLGGDDDRLVLECAVRLVQDGEELRSPAPPPSDLQRDLRRMLAHGDGADVTLVAAGGQRFRAHRCVLAARSPVLQALLFGPMRDGRDAVELADDVAPEVFAAVLRYIYGDALPVTTGDDDGEADARVLRQLLAAADLYALDGLSRSCQDMLGRCVTPCTAAETYAIAERLNLPRLKAAVVESVAGSRHGLAAVRASPGFKELAAEDAAVAEEMASKVTMARGGKPAPGVSCEEILLVSLGIVVFTVIWCRL